MNVENTEKNHYQKLPPLKTFFESKKAQVTAFIVLGIIAALLIFQAGIFVGYHKAVFSYRSAENYYKVIQGSQMPDFPLPMKEDFSGGHGAVGRVVGVSLPSIVIASPDNVEKTIYVGTSSIVRKFRDTVKAADIYTDDIILVLGDPDSSGRIVAKFIRIMPPPYGDGPEEGKTRESR